LLKLLVSIMAFWVVATATLMSGCTSCNRPGQTWTYTGAYSGNIEAPADLGLPARITSGSCAGGFSDGTNSCMQVGVCSPSFCLQAFENGDAALYLTVTLALRLDGPRTFTLPASDVIVNARTSARFDAGSGSDDEPTLVSGVVEILSVSPSFDALVDLVLVTSDGRTITISQARYTRSNGHFEKYCADT
jgi:hypothetical protein